MTKSQRQEHKRWNQARKAANLAGQSPSGVVWPSIQDGKYTTEAMRKARSK